MTSRLNLRPMPRGFSLLELVVAMVLATALLVIVIQFGLNQSRAQRRLVEVTPVEPWLERLQLQLQLDYRSAQSVRVDPHGLTFRSYPPGFSLGSGAHQLLNAPSIVRYVVHQVDREPAELARVTQVLGQAEIQRRLLARNVVRIGLAAPLKTDVPPGQLPVRIEWSRQGVVQSRNIILVRGSGSE